jgi:hypothetical protein
MPLAVKKWDHFQAFKRRRPPWIKLWHGLLTDRKFQGLPVPTKALLPMLWLLASEYPNGVIDLDDASVAWRLHWELEAFISAVEPAVSAGFLLRLAVAPTAENLSQVLEITSHHGSSGTQSQSQRQRIYKNRERIARAGETVFPKAWQPNAVELAYASDRGLDPLETFEHFRAHYQSTDQVRADWRRAWLAWCCKAKQLKEGSNGKTQVNGNGAAHFARSGLKPNRARTAARGLAKAAASRSSDIRRPNGF